MQEGNDGRATSRDEHPKRLPEQERADAPDALTPAMQAMLDAFEQFPVIVFRISADGTMKQHAGGGLADWAASPDEALGRNVIAMFEHAPDVVDVLRRALAGESLSLSGRYGELFYNVRFEPEYIDGKYVGVVGTAFEVSNLINTQAQLARSEERYRTLVQTAAEGIVIVDRLGAMEFVNHRFAAMIGYHPEELVGQDALTVIDELDHPRLFVRAFGATREAVEQIELRYRHRDGTVVPTIVSSRITWDDSGQFVSLVGMVTDITDRMRAEEHHNALQQALFEAETKEQLRLARALHDGPIQSLAAVNLQLGALRRDNNDRALADDLARVEESISATLRSLRLMMFDLEPADPNDLVGAIYSCAALLFSASDTTVRVDGTLPSLDPTIANAVYRIAREALTNAAKHANATRVTVRVAQRDRGVALMVKDDGVGIAGGTATSSGFGLRTMLERATEIGGVATVEALEPRGVGVFAWVPITPQPRTQPLPGCCQ